MQQTSSKAARITGWTFSILLGTFLGSGAVNAWMASPQVVAGTGRFGYTAAFLPALGATELLCVVLFLVPRTAALGAILLTAYFGGAVATHARVSDPLWVVPVIAGVLTWIALLLRDPRFHILRPSRYSRAS